MGRRPLPPEQRAAHGSVKTRISKAQRQAAEREAAAAALAEQPIGTKVEPPAVLRSAHYAKALEVWREVGPELERTNRLQPVHRLAFAMFCIYRAEWAEACEDLAEHGRSQHVATVAGGSMERERPAVRWRAEAYANCMQLGQQFGLTPREEYALFKDQSTVARENPGLFGGKPTPANDAAPAAPPSSIGAMQRFKSAPPATH